MKISKAIENKIGMYIGYHQRADKIRQEITEWFASKGIDASEEDTELNLINDMLIDGSLSGNVYETIEIINKILEEV